MLLQKFPERLRHLVRPSDLVARIGGDEFVVLLLGLRAPSNAEAVAAKVVEAAREPFDINGHTTKVGASVGVAFGIPMGGSWSDLVARADEALYAAKRGGRGRQRLAA